MVKSRKTRVTIAIPSSILSTEPTLEYKTLKVGVIGRYAAIFRVDTVAVYVDSPGAWKDAELIKKLLEYMVVAPYLRKRVYPKGLLELSYAGVLPPLQIPTHGVGGPKEGEIRQAYIVSRKGRRAVVDAGLEGEVEIDVGGLSCKRGDIIHVRIVSLDPLKLEVVREPDVYTGYSVELFRSFKSLVRRYKPSSLMIATSRKGKVVDIELLKEVGEKTREKNSVLIAFGAPDRGLFEIGEAEGVKIEEEFDYILNTVPMQGTRTVRTEEAIAATLSLLNLVLE